MEQNPSNPKDPAFNRGVSPADQARRDTPEADHAAARAQAARESAVSGDVNDVPQKPAEPTPFVPEPVVKPEPAKPTLADAVKEHLADIKRISADLLRASPSAIQSLSEELKVSAAKLKKAM